MRTAKPKSERSKKREAEKSVLRLSRLFQDGEMFTHFTFLSRCRKQYGIEAEKAEGFFCRIVAKKIRVIRAKRWFVSGHPGLPGTR